MTAIAPRSGSMSIVSNDPLTIDSALFNRTRVSLGGAVSLQFSVSHRSASQVQTVWLKDGSISRFKDQIRIEQNSDTGYHTISTTQLVNRFNESDVGVYQCIFKDTITLELLGSIPLRLDSGIINS